MENAANPALLALGRAVRALRLEHELTRHALGERAGVSERFLVELEAGRGNISVLRLRDVAAALGTDAASLLRRADSAPDRQRPIALLGLRGAGKSTIGARVAERLGSELAELDQLIEQAAGMSLATVFELQGEAFYRRLERDALRRLLASGRRVVIATGGSIVSDSESFELLRAHTVTVWLKARPLDHMQRVLAQGDERPMRNRGDAMAELRALLRARTPLYAQAARVVDTSALGVEGSVNAIVRGLEAHD